MDPASAEPLRGSAAAPRGRGASTSLTVLLLVLPVVVGGGALVVFGGAGSSQSPPPFTISTPQESEWNGSYYTVVPLHNLSTPSVNSLGVTLNANNVSLPLLFPFQQPWQSNTLCGGPGAGPGPRGGAWTYNVTSCHAVQGYWYAALVDDGGAVRDLYLNDIFGPSAVWPYPAWSSAGAPYADAYPGDHLVLVTSGPLLGTATLLQVFLDGSPASARFSGAPAPVPILGLGTVEYVDPCPGSTPGGAQALASVNLSWQVSQPIGLAEVELQLGPSNFSLAQSLSSGVVSCPSLVSSPGSTGLWAAELSVKGDWVATYVDGPSGPAWSLATPGQALPEIYPQEPATLVLYGGPGLVQVAADHLVWAEGGPGTPLESYGGALTNAWGVVLT